MRSADGAVYPGGSGKQRPADCYALSMGLFITTEFENVGGQGIVDFVREEDRRVYLTIGGETAFEGSPDTCDTCASVFTKLTPADSLQESVAAEAAGRISQLLQDVRAMPEARTLAHIGAVLPHGRHSVVLAALTPVLTMPGDSSDYFANEAAATWGIDPYFGVPHSPRTPYYRLGSVRLGAVKYGGSRLGVALGVPLYPPTQPLMVRREMVDRYRRLLRSGSAHPAAFALGVVEDRGPAVWAAERPEFTRHVVVTLFLLDGHHKALAAAEEHLPLQFLIFFPHYHLGRYALDEVNEGLGLLRLVGNLQA